MGRKAVFWTVFLFLLGTNLHAAKKDKHPAEIPPGTITPEAWKFVTDHEVSEKNKGFDNLLAALVELELTGRMPESSMKVVMELGNEDPDLKQMFSSYMAIKSGKEISAESLAKITKISSDPPSWKLGTTKKLLATLVLAAYKQQPKLAANKTQ